MKKIEKLISISLMVVMVLFVNSCKQNDDEDSGDEYIAPISKVFTTDNTVNGDRYIETITALFYKNIYSFEKRTGVTYDKNYEIDVTESVNACYSEIAEFMISGGYVIAEANSTGTKNGNPLSTTNCYRRNGNKYYLNSNIYYR